MKRKEVLEKSGLSEKAVRYYEQQGILNIAKIAGKNQYNEDTLQQCRKIKWLREHGFSVQEIASFFSQDSDIKWMEDKLKQYDQTILNLHRQKEEMIQVLQTKEIPMTLMEQGTPLATSYMMVTDMDRVMGWLNVLLFVLTFGVVVLIHEYRIVSFVALIIGLIGFAYDRSIVEAELDQYDHQLDMTISWKEVLGRTLINFYHHLVMSWCVLNGIDALISLQFDFLSFLSVLLMLFCIAFIRSNIKENFQYRQNFH